jgi:hypothetical protein
MTRWMVAGFASCSCMRQGRAEVLPVRCCTQGKPAGRRCTCCKGQAWDTRTGGSCHAAWAGGVMVSDLRLQLHHCSVVINRLALLLHVKLVWAVHAPPAGSESSRIAHRPLVVCPASDSHTQCGRYCRSRNAWRSTGTTEMRWTPPWSIAPTRPRRCDMACRPPLMPCYCHAGIVKLAAGCALQ